ncbi:MAG: hypothetical protein ACI4DK_08745 [Lachnospiraceae bacterium]
MKEFIKEIYEQYEWELDMFNFHPDEEDDIYETYYVYAWFTKGETKKYFYIGKGKNSRYNHILKEIEAVDKGKYKGKHYKILKERYGIDYELLYDKLTACEASVLEAYLIMTYMQKKEPLLNVILPAAIMEDEKLSKFRDSYFYEKDDEKFLEFYK